ncbi:MAG: STAS domain-containing protein [Defluviitaleaceae bacterium]|nr:STAS domain-containing protein [Defluviitaleaceae bacterium]
MTITQKAENGTLILTLEGRLDTATSPQLQDTLLPVFGENKDVVLDFSKLAYVSSAGLRVLLMGQKEAQGKGASMKLSNVSSDIMEVFEMTGFSDILSFA